MAAFHLKRNSINFFFSRLIMTACAICEREVEGDTYNAPPHVRMCLRAFLQMSFSLWNFCFRIVRCVLCVRLMFKSNLTRHTHAHAERTRVRASSTTTKFDNQPASHIYAIRTHTYTSLPPSCESCVHPNETIKWKKRTDEMMMAWKRTHLINILGI